jgi:hypothetical protein
MGAIQFVATTPQELQTKISEGIKIQLDEFLKHFKPEPKKEYLSRKDVATMFGVDISSVHNWSKSGRINPLQIGGRVYFLRSEIEASVKPLNI